MIHFDPTDRDRREPRKQRSNNRAVAHLGSVVAVEMADGSAGLALTVSGAILKCFSADAAVELADALIDGIEHIENGCAAGAPTTHDKEKI